ncbi:MAG: bifunctional precorrin-2 dehydrogenase/sirohydrochlorin ferrochelatase [Chitinophagales bacterium]|nr:bifunctional precorrin-2 dehydrogenase/sirohydrochlorin ferrochelatase [Chitinophagales bacterium]
MNTLYPIFLKLHQLKVLIVGAGEVGCEKLTFMLKSSPDAAITVVAKEILSPVQTLLKEYPDANLRIVIKPFELSDAEGYDLVIAATNFQDLNKRVQQAAKKHGALVNVADTPSLCDFYLGSIVTRGDLKVAISTNGKSPTFAKRFRQWLEAALPKEASSLIQHLHQFRNQLSDDFSSKVKALNKATESLLTKQSKSL